MATQVYLSVRNVIVAQSGTTTLTIREDWAKYLIIIPTSSVSGIDPLVPQYVRFLNTYTNELRTSLISDVIDNLGNGFADLNALQKYLAFIPRATSIKETKEAATAANQLLLLAQGVEILEKAETNIQNTNELNSIKNEQKTSNKILKKIYNP